MNLSSLQIFEISRGSYLEKPSAL